jgi:hypothetical protein
MLMEYTAMVRRGWPNEGAIDRAENIKALTTLSNGDWVTRQADGSVDKAGTAGNLSTIVGLVVSGNGDTSAIPVVISGVTIPGLFTGNSSAVTGKAVVLWSGFTVEVSNFAGAIGSFANGAAVTTKAANPGQLVVGVVGTDNIVGHVIGITPGVAGRDTASITILVK